MIACAALAVAAACAGPPISSYVVPFEATSVAVRPNRVLFIISGDGRRRVHVRTIGPTGRRRVVRGFDRYLDVSRKVFAGTDQDPDLEAYVQQSGRWIVVRASTTRYFYDGAEDFRVPSGEIVVAGTARGRARELQVCPGGIEAGIDSLDGSRLAITSCDRSKLLVWDLARPRARPVVISMRRSPAARRAILGWRAATSRSPSMGPTSRARWGP